jgi:hypothetical protein
MVVAAVAAIGMTAMPSSAVIVTISRTAIPCATDADTHARRVAVAVAVATTVITVVARRPVIAVVVHGGAAAIVDVTLVAVVAHVTVARVVVAAGQRYRRNQAQDGDSAFHERSPRERCPTLDRDG